MDHIIRFYNEYLPELSQFKARHGRFKALFEEIVKPGMDVLDIGCGTGITSKLLADRGANVVAVDIAPKLIEYARKHCNHKNIVYLIQDATELQLSQRFDRIILADVFEHILPSKIEMLMDRLVRYSKASTHIYLNLPDPNFHDFTRTSYPERLQIVDEKYTVQEILGLFLAFNFVPNFMRIYGNVHYNEYMFTNLGSLQKCYQHEAKVLENEQK